MKRISFSLSEKSIDAAIKELEEYKKKLIEKNELFIQKCTEAGIEVIHATMRNVDLGEDEWDYSVETITQSGGTAAAETIVVSGKRLLYVEFGSGVLHSQPQNPKAQELGYGVGTNSPAGWAWNTTKYGGGWYYTHERTGERIHTEGNSAYMPVYQSSVEMRKRVVEIAKEVFQA